MMFASKKYLVLVFPLVIFIVLELTLGRAVHNTFIEELNAEQFHWSLKAFKSADDSAFVPATKDKIRIAYISNSHAYTGGKISNHLQEFLDYLFPGSYELMDMSDAGIFTPDMLQRTIKAVQYEADFVIVGVGYISFSNQMSLHLQASTSKSFFNPGIPSYLRSNFWLTNYDIGLYADTLVSSKLNLIRYRNEIRDLLFEPWANSLRKLTGSRKPVFTMEIDESGRWRFPDGYDNNLFQWDLYSTARDHHLLALRDLTTLLHERGIESIVFNEPIDFNKSFYDHDSQDYIKFRGEVDGYVAPGVQFLDKEHYFPKEMSTYDALHPTYHGARLHALDLVIHLSSRGAIPEIDEKKLLSYFEDDFSERDYTAAVRAALATPASRIGFIRKDASDTDNLKSLVDPLKVYDLGGNLNLDLTYKMALQFEYWKSNHAYSGTHPLDDSLWQNAVRHEFDTQMKKQQIFVDMISGKIEEAMQDLTIADECRATEEVVTTLNTGFDFPITLRTVDTEKITCKWYFQSNGNMFAFEIKNKETGSSFRRTDIFGNGTYTFLQPADGSMVLPPSMIPEQKRPKIGI